MEVRSEGQMNALKRRETLTGFVVPAHWDDNNEVTSVLIACEGERDVFVDGLSECPILLSLLQKKATLTGEVTLVRGVERIRVESVAIPPDNRDRARAE